MRFPLILASSIFLLIAGSAAQAAVPLFKVFKPINSHNVLLISININNSNPSARDFCKPRDLDFLWIMNHGRSDQYTKRSMVEGRIRERFPVSRTNPANSASCQSQNSKDGTCASVSVRTEEFDWVEHGLRDSALVVRATRQGNKCSVGAFLDAGEKGVVQIKSLTAVGEVLQSPSIFNPSATIRVKSLTVESSGGSKEIYVCRKSCVKKISF